MKTVFYIILAVIIILAAAAIYLFYKNKKSNSGNANTTPGLGNATPLPATILLGQNSSQVSISDITATQGASFDNITEASLPSFNVLTSPGSNPGKIHFVVSFNTTCAPFVWYKNWLYSYLGSTQDTVSGNKTCYYGINSAKLPAELLVDPTGTSCQNFKLYISGIEYKYDSIKPVKKGFVFVPHCVYKK